MEMNIVTALFFEKILKCPEFLTSIEVKEGIVFEELLDEND